MTPLFFCKALTNDVLSLSSVLLAFEVVSSLKANLEKNLVFLVRNVENAGQFALELGCSTLYSPHFTSVCL